MPTRHPMIARRAFRHRQRTVAAEAPLTATTAERVAYLRQGLAKDAGPPARRVPPEVSAVIAKTHERLLQEATGGPKPAPTAAQVLAADKEFWRQREADLAEEIATKMDADFAAPAPPPAKAVTVQTTEAVDVPASPPLEPAQTRRVKLTREYVAERDKAGEKGSGGDQTKTPSGPSAARQPADTTSRQPVGEEPQGAPRDERKGKP